MPQSCYRERILLLVIYLSCNHLETKEVLTIKRKAHNPTWTFSTKYISSSKSICDVLLLSHEGDVN